MNYAPVVDSFAALAVSGFLLDLAIGDPRWFPHPVVMMGKAISWGEKLLWSGEPRRDFLAGMALTLAVVGPSAAIAWAAVLLVSLLPSAVAFNFLPARLTALVMIVAASLLKLRARLAAKVVWRDHANHLSPNAGYPEAALAGAFGIRLGGPSTYFGKQVAKPYIGEEATPVKIEMLKEARSLCLVTAILSLVIFVLMSTAHS